MIQPQLTWPAAPQKIRVNAGEVHLWKANLDTPAMVEQCRAVLSPDELVRAARFHFKEDAEQFIAARGAVRMILARYLCEDPENLVFRVGNHGKPFVFHPFMDIRFNVSHSRDLAIIAVSRGREVGVDVEWIQHDMTFEPIAEHYFEPHENWDLRTAPKSERVSRFFDLWTQKEARLKAEGVGLVASPARESSWSVRRLSPAAGYAGAIACEGEDWDLAYWEWSL